MRDFLFILTLFGIWGYAWRVSWLYFSKKLKTKVRAHVITHMLGLSFCLFPALLLSAVWIDKSGQSVSEVLIGIVFLAPFILMHRTVRKLDLPVEAAPDKPPVDLHRITEDQAEKEAIAKAKRESESAAKLEKERAILAKLARDKNAIAHSAQISSSYTPPKKSPRISRKDSKKLDTIRFSYMDREGDITERRVVVHVVDSEYFEGFCLTRKAKRTFRYDGVIGLITSEETGEMLDPEDWALQV